MDKEKERKGHLLVVDDDSTFLLLLERIFGKHFLIKTANGGPKALDMMANGYRPEVILSDYNMPVMNGVEFLDKSVHYVPDAVKIILTVEANPKEIIAWLNKGCTFMYLNKPCNEMELIQSVRIAFDYYHTRIKNRDLTKRLSFTTKELKDKHETLKKYVFESRSILNQTLQALSGMIHIKEKLYFTPHSTSVAMISKSIAEAMGWEADTVGMVVSAALLHGCTTLAMPHRFFTKDPYEMNDDDIALYFEYFERGLAPLKKITHMEHVSGIIKHIWEHNDGSGYPYGLSTGQIMKEAQVVALANIYHNKVYRVADESVPELLAHGKLVQSVEQTKQRHMEAIKFFYKKAQWFDIDILNEFQDLVKKKSCPPLLPADHDLDLVFDGFMLSDMPHIAGNMANNNSTNGKADLQGTDQIKMEIDSNGTKTIEKEIPIQQLEPGMLCGQNIVTRNGILIVRQDTRLEPAVVRNIKQLESTGMLSGEVTIIAEA